MKIPWWAMYVVIEDKDFAETVDIATESFVEHILGQISNLRLSDDGERGVKSLSKHEITKKSIYFCENERFNSLFETERRDPYRASSRVSVLFEAISGSFGASRSIYFCLLQKIYFRIGLLFLCCFTCMNWNCLS